MRRGLLAKWHRFLFSFRHAIFIYISYVDKGVLLRPIDFSLLYTFPSGPSANPTASTAPIVRWYLRCGSAEFVLILDESNAKFLNKQKDIIDCVTGPNKAIQSSQMSNTTENISNRSKLKPMCSWGFGAASREIQWKMHLHLRIFSRPRINQLELESCDRKQKKTAKFISLRVLTAYFDVLI